MYGGLEAVESACGGCPANAIGHIHTEALASCYGVVPLPEDEGRMHEAVERAIERAGLAPEVERMFPATQPRWYGLWMHSPLNTEQAAIVERLLDWVAADEIGCREVLEEFRLGLQTANANGLRFHHALYPRGVVEGARWRMVRHCPVCRAPWLSTAMNQGRPEACPTCGHVGHPAPEKKRMARGKRPYFPLDRLLGGESAKLLLARYAAWRAETIAGSGANPASASAAR